MKFNRKILVEKKSKTIITGTLFPNGVPDIIVSMSRSHVAVGKTITLTKNRRTYEEPYYMTFEMHDVKTVSKRLGYEK
jgi:hypothetical protein